MKKNEQKSEEDIAEVIRKKLEEHKKKVGGSFSKTNSNPHVFSKTEVVRKPEISLKPTTASLDLKSSRNESMQIPKIKEKKRKAIFFIIFFLLFIGIIIFVFLAILYYNNSPNKNEIEIYPSEGIEKATVIDGKTAFVVIDSGVDLNKVSNVILVFFAKDNSEFIYEPEFVAEQYEIFADYLGRDNFRDIVFVRATFEYFVDLPQEENNFSFIIPTRNQTNQSQIIGGGGGSGGGGSGGGGSTVTPPVCIPNCALKKCGDNGCGGSCQTCISGYTCIVGRCIFSEGLVSYWNFEGNPNDVVGNNHGTINETTLTQGIFGQGYYFDGIDGYITIGNYSALNTLKNLTISAWFINIGNQTNGWTALGNRYDNLVTKWDCTSACNDSSWWLGISPKGHLQFIYINESDKSSGLEGVSYIRDDKKWHNAAVTFNGTSLVLYLDGKMEAKREVFGEIKVNDTMPVIIGTAGNTLPSAFNGTIDEVKIWNHALSDKEIKTDFYSYNTPEVLSYWSFDYDANDTVGGVNGNVSGAVKVPGIIGNAYKFDGINDYIRTVPCDHFENFQKGTITAWIKCESECKKSSIFSYTSKSSSEGNYVLTVKDNLLMVSWHPDNAESYNIINSSVRINDSKWHFIAVVSDGISRTKLYLDGVEQNTEYIALSGDGNEGDWFADVNATESVNHVSIGNLDRLNPFSYFNGTIDEVKVWSRPLTSQEILFEYNLFNPYPRLVSYWNFDGDAKDSVGGYNGIVNGATLRKGVKGAGYSFDGFNDFINISKMEDLGQQGTISVWINNRNISYGTRPNIIHLKTTGSSNSIGLYRNPGWADNELGWLNYFTTPIGTVLSVQLTSNYSISEWKHTAFTWDEEGNLKTYIDGELSRNYTLTYFSNWNSGAEYLLLGGGSLYSFFNGSIDELKMWNYDLTEEEISAEYDSGKSSIVQEPRLISYWNFDGDAKDSIGENDGVVYGATLSDGISGQAYKFDGIDDYIDLERPVVKTTSFTVSGWAYVEGDGGGIHRNNAIFQQRNNTVSDNSSTILLSTYVNSSIYSGESLFQVRSNKGLKQEIFTSEKPRNSWHHYAGVVNSSTILLYVDGKLENYTQNLQAGDYTNVDWTYIGRGRYEGVSNYFNGSIDEVKIWNYALNNEEIVVEYNKNNINGLVSYWNFDLDANDLIGENDGVVYGAALTDGISGQAYKFDGVDDYIDFGDIDAIDGITGMSVCAWINITSEDGLGLIGKSRYGWALYKAGPVDTVIFYVDFDGVAVWDSYIVGTTLVDDGKWHYLCGVYNGTSNLQLYIDNRSQGVIMGVEPANLISSLENLTVGFSNGYYANGTIDEVKIWNYALNWEEISTEYGSYYFGTANSQKEQVSTVSFFSTIISRMKKIKSLIFSF